MEAEDGVWSIEVVPIQGLAAACLCLPLNGFANTDLMLEIPLLSVLLRYGVDVILLDDRLAALPVRVRASLRTSVTSLLPVRARIWLLFLRARRGVAVASLLLAAALLLFLVLLLGVALRVLGLILSLTAPATGVIAVLSSPSPVALAITITIALIHALLRLVGAIIVVGLLTTVVPAVAVIASSVVPV